LSLPIDETGNRVDIRVHLGLMLLNDIVPRILEEGRWIGERVSLAETWYIYLCSKEACPEVDSNPDNWGTKELKTIAKALVAYAGKLLEPYLKTPPRQATRRRGSSGSEELPF